MKIAIALFCITFFSLIHPIYGQWGPKVSIEDHWRWKGLNFLNEYDITSGAKGLGDEVWFVHKEGLLRYSGFEVQQYPIRRLAELASKDIFVVSDGRVLVTTDNELMVWQDGKSQFFNRPDIEFFIRNGVVQRGDGRILVAAETGIFELKEAGLHKIATQNERISSLLFDAEGNLWVGEIGRQITVYALTTVAGNFVPEVIHQFKASPNNPLGPYMFMDSNKRVWVLDPDHEDACYYYENYRRKLGLTGLKGLGVLSEGMRMVEPRVGEFWICAARRLAHWDGKELRVYGIEDYPIPSSYPYIIPISESRYVLGGLNLTPHLFNFSDQCWTSFEGLNFQCEDGEGGLWFLAEDRRVVRFDGSKWKVFTTADGVIDKPNRVITTGGGLLWASGSHQGVAAVSLYQNGTWVPYSFPAVGLTFSHLAALETTVGEIIFGGGTPENLLGNSTGGAVVFRKTEQGYRGRHHPYPAFAKRTANIVERKGDGLLLSTGSVFKARSDESYINTTQSVFSRQWIDHMVVDRMNDLWVACLGVGLYQNDGKKWTVHGLKTGLNTKNIIYLLEERTRGGILALTDKGFYRYDGVTWGKWGSLIDFPFARENHTVFQSRDGAVWLNFASRSWLLELRGFGKHNYRFQTLRYKPEMVAPETWASTLHTEFPEGGQVQIRFGGADYWEEASRDELVYSWSMDGKDWSPFSSETSVTFNELGAGFYRLWVRTRDLCGNVDMTPAVVSFTVQPPLWRQIWFIVLMLSLAAAICFLVYSLYNTRLRAALALDEFKLDFFTNISHELRTPLAVIISPLEMLLASDLEGGVRKKLQIVLRNARRMQGMIDQLLEFRKIEKGRWLLNHEGGEIISFTKELVMNQEPVWQSKNQTLSFETLKESHLCSFDTSSLQKIVDNLLSNAIKYSDEKTCIRVRTKIANYDGFDHYILEVEDEGPGIPLHEQKNVLQPFYRVRRYSHQEGSGVGLAFVNQLVRLWGGSVEIESPLPDIERGTKFVVTLPLEPFKEPKGMEQETALVGRPGDDRPTLLFVEDNEDMRHILVDAFAEEYHVLEAGDGLLGLQLAQKIDPDIVITDVIMPGLSGTELCEKLKTDPETSHIPVVLLTARSSVEHRIEGLKAGADAYIPKPLDLRHLRVRIENLLQSRRDLKKKFAKQLVIEASEITVTPTDELILNKALKVVEDCMMDEDFSVDRFAHLMGMSRSTLKRKLTAVTGLSPQPFIQQLRLKRAAKLLASGGVSVSEAARMVGFYDLSYFGSVFKKHFGCTPSHYAQEKKGD